MKFRCRGMKHIFELAQMSFDSACVGCEITTDGSWIPDRCAFSNGPDKVRWYEIESTDDSIEYDRGKYWDSQQKRGHDE
jgi:hypothetical protein